MRFSEYESVAADAVAASVAAEPAEAARLRFEACDAVPRFPSLQKVHAELLAPLLDVLDEGAEPAVAAEALRRGLHVARVAGIDALVLTLAEGARELAQRHGDDAFVSWVADVAHAADSARQRGYASALDAWRRLEARTEALGRPDLSLDVDLVRLDIELRQSNSNAVLNAADALLANLEALDDSFDGERYYALTAIGLMRVQRDDHDATEAVLQAGLALTRKHGLPVDTGQALLGVVPLWLNQRRPRTAVEALQPAIDALRELEGAGPLEMPLWQLYIRAIADTGDLAAAIRAGFDAVERSGVVGNVENFTAFLLTTATLYYDAKAWRQVYTVLCMAEDALVRRGDAPELVARVQQAKEAYQADIGSERYAAIVKAHEAGEG